MNDESPTVERSRVGDRVLIIEAGGAGCVSLPAGAVSDLMAELEEVDNAQ